MMYSTSSNVDASTAEHVLLSERQPFEPEMVHIPAGLFLMGMSDRQIDWLARDMDPAKKWQEKGYFGREQPQPVREYKQQVREEIVPPGYVLKTHHDDQGQLHREVEYDQTAFFLSAWLRCLVFNLLTRFAEALGGEYSTVWAGTLLRRFIRRPATLYRVGKDLHIVFDPFPDQDALQPQLDRLNAKRTALLWLNNLVVQFNLAQDEPVHPLMEPEKRKRLFGDG